MKRKSCMQWQYLKLLTICIDRYAYYIDCNNQASKQKQPREGERRVSKNMMKKNNWIKIQNMRRATCTRYTRSVRSFAIKADPSDFINAPKLLWHCVWVASAVVCIVYIYWMCGLILAALTFQEIHNQKSNYHNEKHMYQSHLLFFFLSAIDNIRVAFTRHASTHR